MRLPRKLAGWLRKFSDKLKGELIGAMKAEGPVKAIEVCNVAAPAIAAEVSTDGWTVKRTSLKLRNAKAEPDKWERQTLETFEAEKAKGADVTKLERAEIVDAGGVRTFRYMKAIPTAAEPCLACHGGSIAEPVKAKLAELYPRGPGHGLQGGRYPRRVHAVEAVEVAGSRASGSHAGRPAGRLERLGNPRWLRIFNSGRELTFGYSAGIKALPNRPLAEYQGGLYSHGVRPAQHQPKRASTVFVSSTSYHYSAP